MRRGSVALLWALVVLQAIQLEHWATMGFACIGLGFAATDLIWRATD